MKERLKTTSFWLGLSGAVVIIVESISSLFNVKIASSVVEGVIMTICSVLVLLGIITKKTTADVEDVSKEELLMEFKEINNSERDESEK